MGKRAKRKDFMVEIWRSMNRFLSILFIVALGTAFFSGIRAARPDMEASADKLYDDTNLMDIRIVGTLGLTEGDVKAVSQLPQIQKAEGAYTADVLCQGEDREQVMRIFSITPDINQFTLVEGRMPKGPGECLLDRGKSYGSQFKLGDKLKVYSGTKDNIKDTLKTDTFTVVGIGTSSRYLSLERGTSSIGNGRLDSFMAVTPDNFNLEVYTDIYATTKKGRGMLSYSDGYKDYIDSITKDVEDHLSGDRCRIRYQEVMDEGNGKLNDARQELADKKAEADEELGKAAKEIEDAQAKMDEGQADVDKGQADLDQGKKELAKSEKDLAEGKKQLSEKQVELQEAKTTLAEKEKELGDAKVTLAEKEKELEDGKKELAFNEKKLANAKKLFEEKYPEARMDLDAGWIEYNNGKDDYDKGQEEFKEQQEKLKEGWKEYRKSASQLEQALKTALRGLLAMGVPMDLTPGEIGSIKVETWDIGPYEPYLSLLPAGQGIQLAQGVRQLQASYQQLVDGDGQVKEGRIQMEQARKQLVSAKKKLDAGEMKLKNGQRQLDEGQKEMDDSKIKLADGEKEIADARQKLADGEKEIADGHQKITDGEKEIADGWNTIRDGEAKIPKAKKDIAKWEAKIADAKKQLADGKADLEEGKKKYQDAKEEADEKLADAQKKIDDAQKDLDDVKAPEWYVLGRDSIQTYVEYGSDSERIGAIGKVFPFIFFLVAALVSLTTMTRMVEEQRLQIGTLKALGYGKWSIASKYILYAFLATLAGSALGVAVGERVLPYVIMTAYYILYENIPYMLIPFNLHYALVAAGLAMGCTVLATWFACYKELLSVPAALMRPVPPKQGKRVLLEYVTPLWKRLKFIQKATVRNIFRYKKRCLMTIFGIGGCMALLLVGFGLHDSIYTLGDRQYNDIWTYDVQLQLNGDAKEADQEKLDQLVSGPEVQAHMKVDQTRMDVAANGVTKEAYLFVPEDLSMVGRFVHLRNRVTKKPLKIDGSHVVITEKLADLLQVSVGDVVNLKEDEGTLYPVVVGGIAENYLHHYVYMSPGLYEKVYGKPVKYNTMFLGVDQLENQGSGQQAQEEKQVENRLGRELTNLDAVMSVTFIGTLRGQIQDMLNSLNVVIWVLIISAGLLAFVVLYNLNNININERMRELATIKVLGFYDKELAAYVYRENVLLTLMGCVVGAVLGYFLHRYVMSTVEVDMMMFGRQIRLASYLYSVVLTCGFSGFVNLVMFYKLRKIDMVESLKSVE